MREQAYKSSRIFVLDGQLHYSPVQLVNFNLNGFMDRRIICKPIYFFMILRTYFPFDTYGVSSCGQVKNRKTGKFLKQSKNQDGYLVVGLRNGGHTQTFRVHRLVALLYIPNPHNLPQVNHEDLDKQNNHKSNLTWVTGQENVIHAVANGRKGSRPQRAVYKLSFGRKVLDTYNSVCEAAKHNGLDFSNIYSVLRGERNQAGGFYWEFA